MRNPPGREVRDPITPADIDAALAADRLETECWDVVPKRQPFSTESERRDWHAGRIGYLVRCGWLVPIKVQARQLRDDVALTIHDGSHRLRAAIMRHDRHIELLIIGDVRLFQTFTEWMEV